MLTSISLKCSSCGAGLNIPSDIDQLACGFCGIEQTVQRVGGIIALKPVTDALKQVQVGTDKTAAELALRRLYDEWHAAMYRRNNMIAYWQWQHYGAGRQAFNRSLFLAAIVFFGSIFLSFFIGSQMPAASKSGAALAPLTWLLGVVGGGSIGIYLIILGHRTVKKEEAKVDLQRDEALRQSDAQFQALNELIERNKQIVNS
jgi:hypothetical protein